VTRRQHVPENARRNTFYLTPAQEYAIDTIQKLRRHHNDSRDSPSEIVADAIWKWLVDVEHVKRDEIEARFPSPPVQEQPRNKITQMPKPKKKR
jgi:hypothetical protein